MFYLFY